MARNVGAVGQDSVRGLDAALERRVHHSVEGHVPQAGAQGSRLPASDGVEQDPGCATGQDPGGVRRRPAMADQQDGGHSAAA